VKWRLKPSFRPVDSETTTAYNAQQLLSNKKENNMRVRKGFTLVELLVVVLILSALAFIAVPRISQSATDAKVSACKTNVDLLNSQIELYYAQKGSWPSDLSDVTGDVTYFPDGEPVCPFGDAYKYDKKTHHVAAHKH
jgi:prepilin-type N-terminal cleavage/methylation domain-containing protein